MSSISRIDGSPLSDATEFQTEIQQTNTPAIQPTDSNAVGAAGTAAVSDELMPFDPNSVENLFGLNPQNAPVSPQTPIADPFGSAGSISGSTTVGQFNANSGGGSVQGQTDISGRADYGLAVDLEHGTANANVDLGGSVDSHYDASYTGSATVGGHDVGIDANVGVDLHGAAEGSASAEVTLNDSGGKVDVQGQAFAGAQAGIEGSASASIDGKQIAGVEGGVSGSVGVGVEGGVSIGYQDGVLSFGVSGGAALGIGGKASFGFNVNVGAIGDAIGGFAGDVAGALGGAAGAVAGALGDAAGAVAGAFSDAAGAAASAAGAVGGALVDAAGAIGGAIGDAVGAIGDAAGSVAGALGDAASAIGDFFSGIFGGSSSESGTQGPAGGERAEGEVTGGSDSGERPETGGGTEAPANTSGSGEPSGTTGGDEPQGSGDGPTDPGSGGDGGGDGGGESGMTNDFDDGSGGGYSGPSWLTQHFPGYGTGDTGDSMDTDGGDPGDDGGSGGSGVIDVGSFYGSGHTDFGIGTGPADGESGDGGDWDFGGTVMPNAGPYTGDYDTFVNPRASVANISLNNSFLNALTFGLYTPNDVTIGRVGSSSQL